MTADEELDEAYCPDCGRMIDEEMQGYDDVCSAPYVCEAGDLHCIPCGRKCSEAMERDDEENSYGLDYDPYDEIGESRFGLPGGGRSS
jgi:hypothetical protein